MIEEPYESAELRKLVRKTLLSAIVGTAANVATAPFWLPAGAPPPFSPAPRYYVPPPYYPPPPYYYGPR